MTHSEQPKEEKATETSSCRSDEEELVVGSGNHCKQSQTCSNGAKEGTSPRHATEAKDGGEVIMETPFQRARMMDLGVGTDKEKTGCHIRSYLRGRNRAQQESYPREEDSSC